MKRAPVLDHPPAAGGHEALARFRAVLIARLGLVYDDRQAPMLAELCSAAPRAGRSTARAIWTRWNPTCCRARFRPWRPS